MLTLAQTLANLTAARTVQGTTSRKVGDLSLAHDGKELREVTRKTRTVAPVTEDPMVALALAMLGFIKKADPRAMATAQDFGLPIESLGLSSADATAKLEEVLTAGGDCSPAALATHRDNCAAQVRAAIAGGLKISKAYGPAANDLLTLAMSADCAAIVAGMASAKLALAKAAQEAQAKAEAAAARKAKLAAQSKASAPVAKPKQLTPAQQAQVAAWMAAA